MATKTIAFKDIKIQPQEYSPRADQVQDLSKVRQFQIGNGQNVLRFDRQGLWLGAEKFADAPFRVDMQGNVVGITFDAAEVTGLVVNSGVLNSSEINGGTINGTIITGGMFRTAASGLRIEIDSSTEQNEIRFFDASTLYATMRVRTDAGDGFVEIKDPDGAGIEILSGVGSSGFGATQILSVGGIITSNGNATNSFNGLIGRGGTVMLYVGNQSAGADNIFMLNIPTSDSGLPVGAVWRDGTTLKIKT